jgi:hypothetical protein
VAPGISASAKTSPRSSTKKTLWLLENSFHCSHSSSIVVTVPEPENGGAGKVVLESVSILKQSSHVSGGLSVSGGGCDRCTSIVGFAVWWVIGTEAEPDSSCCDTVPPQLPTPIALSIVLESNIGFKQSLLTDAA